VENVVLVESVHHHSIFYNLFMILSELFLHSIVLSQLLNDFIIQTLDSRSVPRLLLQKTKYNMLSVQ